MTVQAIANPLPIFIGLDGRPLTSGYVYIGLPDQDPRQYPSTVYYDQALTVPASQPLRTNSGFLYHNGAPTNIWTDGAAHSLMVLDSTGRQVSYTTSFLGTLPAVIQTTSTVDVFSGTGAPATYALAVTPASENDTDVYVSGVYQPKSTYSVSGNQLSGTFAAGSNNVEVVSRVLSDAASLSADLAAYVAQAQDWAISQQSPDGTHQSSQTYAMQSALSASQSQGYANAAASALAGLGIAKYYDTVALMTADIANIAANAVVEVFQDENKGKRRTLYQKVSGVLTFKCFADGPQTSTGVNRPVGVVVHLGDSNTNGRPGWRTAYTAEWLGKGGIFEGWTSYNMGHNGSQLNGWANTLIADAENPASAGFMPDDYEFPDPDPDHEVIRTINANPDWIRIRLGTNDLNNPTDRATGAGVEATLRTNLAKLVNYLLSRTKARILLVCPQPFLYDDFITGGTNVTQWANHADTDEANRRLRQVYSEWIGVSDRVMVHMTHEDIYGNSVADRLVNAQDPYLGAGHPLIDDALHSSALGSRREAQREALMIVPGYTKSPIYDVAPTAVYEDTLWSCTLFVRGSVAGAVTSFACDVDYDVGAVISGTGNGTGTVGDDGRLNSIRDKSVVEAVSKTVRHSALNELVAVVRKAKLFAYSWASGVTTQIDNVVVNQRVTAVNPHYVQMTVSGAHTNMAGFGAGLVTFFVKDDSALPFRRPASLSISLTTTEQLFGPPYSGTMKLAGGVGFKKGHANTGVVTIYLQNQSDGRYVSGPDNLAAPGKVVGTFTWGANVARSVFAFDATNYPSGEITIASGEWLDAKVTTGTIATEFAGVVNITLGNAP